MFDSIALRRSLSMAFLAAAMAAIAGCALAPQSSTGGPSPTPTAVGVSLTGNHAPTPAVTLPSISGQSISPAGSPGPTPNPSPTSAFGCPSGPCPSSLDYAVNGCSCAGQTYVDSQVNAQYCCKSGFSDSECPEALQQEALAEATFGSTSDEVEAQLVEVVLQGWPIQVHEKAAPAFQQAAAKIENMRYRILVPPESYNWREIGGHTVLSLHSFGIAVDINPDANPSCGATQECRCLNDLITDMSPEFVQAFKDSGFDWGGDWVEHPDPMHFEWAGWR